MNTFYSNSNEIESRKKFFMTVAEYHGHQNHTYYVKTCLSSDGRYLASGSSDELAYIWNTSRPGAPLVKLSGHTDEVTCIAWCSTGETKVPF